MKKLKIFKSEISKNFIFVNIGNFAYAGINVVYMALIARSLGPYEFGLFSLLFAIYSIILIVSDFGLGTSIVRFSSELYSRNELENFETLLRMTLKIRVIISLVISTFGILLSYLITIYIFKNIQLFLPLIFIVTGSFGISLYEFIRTYFQSKQQFLRSILFINGRALLNLVLILILVFFSILTVLSGVIIITIVPLIISIFFSFFLGLKIFNLRNSKINYKEFLTFNFYIIIANICSMFFYKVDLFFLNFYLNPDAVGYYSAALQISQVITIIISSINFILLPKISSLEDIKQLRIAFKKILLISSILFLIVLQLIFFAPYVIPIIFTQQYNNSIPIIQILIISIAMGFFINPLSIIIYKINKPKILAMLLIIKLSIILLAAPSFISLFNVLGMVYINIVADLIFFSLLFFYLYYKLFYRTTDQI